MAFTVKDRYVFSGLSFECFQRTAVPPPLNVHEVGVQTDEPALPQFAMPSDESSLLHVAPMTTDTDLLFAAERNREYDAELSRQQFRSQKLVEVLQMPPAGRAGSIFGEAASDYSYSAHEEYYSEYSYAADAAPADATPADAPAADADYYEIEYDYSEYSDDGATANMTELLHVDEYAAPAPEPSLSRIPVSSTLYGLHVND